MSTTDITAIVTAHREGDLAAASLRSVGAARAVAETVGARVEVIAVLDRPDAATRALFAGWRGFAMKVIEVDVGDPGLARNGGVAAARGDWIAFLDADDLWCGNWLRDASRMAAAHGARTILHPECNIYFGDDPHIRRHPDMDEPDFDAVSLLARNPWTVLSFTARATLAGLPFGPTRFAEGFGYEDWAWNLAAIRRGYRHKVVPGTAHGVRQRPRSQNGAAKAAGVIPRPVRLV